MNTQLITFPCDFPIKIMGHASGDFEGIVLSILNQHVPDLGEGAIRTKLSANGKYISVTATIIAKSQEQLDELYKALSSNPTILVVL